MRRTFRGYEDGELVRTAVLLQDGDVFLVELWDLVTNERRVIEEIPFDNATDRDAARWMALGAARSAVRFGDELGLG